jgi:hypothetical protein
MPDNQQRWSSGGQCKTSLVARLHNREKNCAGMRFVRGYTEPKRDTLMMSCEAKSQLSDVVAAD